MKIEDIEFTFSDNLNLYSVNFRYKESDLVILGIKNKTTGELLSCKEYRTNVAPRLDIAKSALEGILNKH